MEHSMAKLIRFNNNWKNYFAQEKELFLDALPGQKIESVEHIGATSVVLCATYGTIDLLCSIESSLDFVTIKNLLERKGYIFVEEKSDYLKLLYFVRRNEAGNIVATLRLVEYCSEEYNKIRAFKFYLRERQSNVDKYNQYRQTILDNYGGDLKMYQELKSRYIESVLKDHCEFK